MLLRQRGSRSRGGIEQLHLAKDTIGVLRNDNMLLDVSFSGDKVTSDASRCIFNFQYFFVMCIAFSYSLKIIIL